MQRSDFVAAFTRKSAQVHAFKVPLWGQKSEEDIPLWLSQRMGSGEVYLNQTGGLSAKYVWGTKGCGPGDWIIFDETGNVDFRRAEDFDAQYERLV